MPKVSVVIPMYNSSKYICEAIDSVLAQTYKDFEIIVIDDGSTDNSREAVSKYGEKIRYFYKNNGGSPSARNLGLKNALGDYVAMLDSDDLWFSNKLELQVEIMERNKEVALIATDSESFDEKGLVRSSLARAQRIPDKKSFKHKILQKDFNDGAEIKGNLYRELLSNNFITVSSVMFNKKHLKTVGYFNEELLLAENYDMYLRIAKSYEILYFNKVTTRYRLRDDSQSGTSFERSFRYKKYVGKMWEQQLRIASDEDRGLIKAKIVRSFTIAAWGQLMIDNQKEARRLCFCVLKYNRFKIKIYIYILLSLMPHLFFNLSKKAKLCLR